MQGGQCGVHLCIGGVAGGHLLGAGLVDNAGRGPLFLLWVLDIAQQENQAAALAGGQRDVNLVHADRRPAVRHRVGAGTLLDSLGVGVAAPAAQKGVAARVKAVHRGVDREHGVVVAALAVLGLVVDGAALDLDLAG